MSPNCGYFFLRYTLHRVQLECLILTLRFSSSFKSWLVSKSLLNRRATRTFLVPVNLQDLGARGDSSSDTTSSCQTDETQSWLMIWLVPRLWGLLPTRWHAQSSAQMPTAHLVCCVRVWRRFHVCFGCRSSWMLLHSVFQRSVQRVQKSRSVGPPESQSECYGLPCHRHSAGQSIIALQVTVRSVLGFKCQ